MLRLTDRKFKLLFYFLLFVILNTQLTKNYQKKNPLTNLKSIEVFGLSSQNNFEVSQNLSSLLFQNIFLLDKSIFNNILKENTLIETFDVKKFYPSLIRINIKQADLLALTRQNNKKFYIGSNGKLIPVYKITNFNKELPFVFGKNNHKPFVELKKIIDKSSFKFNEIDSFYYYPSNRWDIKTKSKLLIKLPEKNLLVSLQYVNLIIKNKQFKESKTIDLRISNHIIVSNE